MAYSIDRAALLADQLERFAHSNLYQLAGHVANLQFWLDETVHALRTIDDYPQRFRRLRDSQVEWVKAHGTRVSDYCPLCGGGCEFGPQTPQAPTRIPSDQMAEARSRVRASAYRFLLRSYRARLLDETALREACDRIGVVAESEDLERAQGVTRGESSVADGFEENASQGQVLTWDELASRATPCLRCKSTVRLAGPVTPAGRAQVAAALRAGRAIDVIRLLREDTGSGLVEAKDTYMHLVRKAGECHWCGHQLPAGELVDCPACRALNVTLGGAG